MSELMRHVPHDLFPSFEIIETVWSSARSSDTGYAFVGTDSHGQVRHSGTSARTHMKGPADAVAAG